MNIQPAVSLWNYNHYHPVSSLEEILVELQKYHLGVELWNSWHQDEGLYLPEQQKRLQQALNGMPVSLHAAIGNNELDFLYRQVDAAGALEAKVLVIHTDNISTEDRSLDFELADKIVSRGKNRGVQIALENGQLSVLKNALEAIDDLRICLDIGHVYLTDDPLKSFLEAFQERIVHLHLQDILSEPEEILIGEGGIIRDHYTPGSGGIPDADWALLFKVLKKVDYQGMAVFEVQPRRPLQTALSGTRFLNRFGEIDPGLDKDSREFFAESPLN